MSDPSLSPSLPDPLQSDAVSGGSPPLNEETPIQPDAEAALPAAEAVPDPAEENSPGEEEDDDEEGEEIEDETPATSSTMDLRIQPPNTDSHVSAADATLASPTARRGRNKRKKGKGKSNAKKLKVIEEKLRNLRSNLNPIPFIPRTIPCFSHHEKLFRKLGLWKFVQTSFDKTIRADLIAQLVANYNAKLRSSYVDEYRVMVNRADLARAFELPLKKEKGNAGEAEVDLDFEVLSDDSVGFLEAFVFDWVLLHEEMWMMPNEVMNWMKLIKEGHPEKVDWAGLLWFMVEKELKQGGQLKDCYYASHLQHLIKHQHQNVFFVSELSNGEVESGEECKVVEDGDNEANVEDNGVETHEEEKEGELVVEGPSTELTLGKDGEKEEERVKEVEMMDAEKCKDSGEEVGGEEGEDRKVQGQWLLNGKNNLGEHYMQPCSTGNAEEFVSFEDRKDEDEEEEEEMDEEEDGEEDEEEARNNFDVFPNDDSLGGNGFTGNFLQGMEANQMAFSTQEQLPNSSSVDVRTDVQHIVSAPSFFNNSGKRVIEHDYHHTINDSSKRLRINETWDNNKPVDFGTIVDQIQQLAQKAKMLYEEKEQAAAQSGMHQQMLLNEVQKRDEVIEHLHKAIEDTQKKDVEIARLERELYLMGSVLDGYRTALKDVRKSFAEYKEKAQLAEESTYKDAGPGGLMLTAAEIERRRKKKEEEYKMQCLFVEQKMREVEVEYNGRFDAFFDKINLMDKRLTGIEADAKELILLCLKKKNQKTEVEEEDDDEEEEMHEAAETPVSEPDEPVIDEVSEPVPLTEPEEQVPEAADDLAIPQSDEKVLEAAEPDLPIPQGDEKVLAAAEPNLEIAQGGDKVLAAGEPLIN